MAYRYHKPVLIALMCLLLPLTACTKPARPPQTNTDRGDSTSSDKKSNSTGSNVTDAGLTDEPGVADVRPADDPDADIGAIDLPGAGGEDSSDSSESEAPSDSETQSPSENKMSVEKSPFGKTPDGQEVDIYTCTNDSGAVLKMITFGAAVQSLQVPDREGKLANVQLNFDDLEGYLNHGAHFGCTVGRYANRIAKGKFELDGQVYDKLAINNGENHLHGGENGFDRVVWNAEPVESDVEVGVKFTYTSPDGEEGYPGKLDSTVTYTLTNNNELVIDYKAKTDKPTVLNLTNHCYWNLGGTDAGSILDHVLRLNCDKYLEAGPGLIPTGKLLPVAGTAMDFTKPKKLGADIAELKKDENGPRGYDHCYVVKRDEEFIRPGVVHLAAVVKDPKSGRVMEITTTQPGIQLYTGNFLDGGAPNGGHKQHGAFCLETQHYPDSPNQPDFPSTVLRPGEEYHEITVHSFTVE